jgi:UDP-glucose 4-epimerase
MVSIFLSFILKSQPVTVRGSLERFRDFIYIDDVVSAFRRLGDNGLDGIYNVGTGRKTTVNELLKSLVTAMGENPLNYPIQIVEGTIRDQFGVYADNTLLRSTGWVPTIPLEVGLDRIAAWALESRFAHQYKGDT